MAKTTPVPTQVVRAFEQGADMISFYSDIAQVVNTGHEVVFQFYETIPGIPESDGQIRAATTRLRASITISIPHATNIGTLLLKQASGVATPAGSKKLLQ